MTTCQVCKDKTHEIAWAWQPFGPDESALCFTSLGWHYRGFPVIKVCSQCHEDIQLESAYVEFTYQGQHYIVDGDIIRAVPAYVSDALLWLESQERDIH